MGVRGRSPLGGLLMPIWSTDRALVSCAFGEVAMALDYATKAIMEQFASSGAKPLHESSVEEARELTKAFAAMAGPAPTMARSEDHEVAVDGGSIPVRVLVPPQGARGVIVYYHGGGWGIGAGGGVRNHGPQLGRRDPGRP